MLIIQRPTVEAIGEEEDNRQKFAVGPLDPGFGHTLGNSLRRTLLSSIPGAAITQVRFDEALHEFTTLPGVKEDVTDIILNLKDLLFTGPQRRAGDHPPRQAGPGRGHRRRHPAHLRRRGPQPRPAHRLPQLQGPHRRGPDRRAWPRLPVGRQEQGHRRHRRHPGRRHLLARAPGGLHRRAGAGRAVHRLRPPGHRDRDRRLPHPPRGRWPRRATPSAPWSAWWPTSRRSPWASS